MATLEEMRGRAAAAKARAEAAVKRLSPEDIEFERLADEEASALAEEKAAVGVERRKEARQREGQAKAVAKGVYFVRGVDLAEFLPPEAMDGAVPIEGIPNRGIFVIRSADPMIERAKNIEIEAKHRSIDVIFQDYACACTVDPPQDGESGIRFRQFVEDPKYAGIVTQIVSVAHELIGLRQKEAKRGRG